MRRKNMSDRAWLSRPAATGVVASTLVAFGQHAAASEQPAAGHLEEIVVTAQKRSENIQDVPISAQIIGGGRLAEQNLVSLEDIGATVPSVRVTGTIGRSGELYIRGVGTGNNQAFDQAVSTFIDDVYHGRAHLSGGTFLDLERVEILKGPQSTFFGNNAIAGAFNIVTRKPTDRFEGFARALYGEHGRYAFEGALGGPITDSFGARMAAAYNGVDGWVENVTTGDDQPRERNLAGRVSLLFEPSDNLDVSLKVEGAKNRNESGIYATLYDCPPGPPFTVAGFCGVALASGMPIGNSGLNAQNAGQEIHLDTVDSLLTINYDKWGHSFTSVSGFYRYRYHLNLDADVTPVQLVAIQAPEEYDQFSQELRVASPTDGPIEYLAGVYFQTDDLFYRGDQTFFVFNPVVNATPPLQPLIPYLPIGQRIDTDQTEDLFSVFGAVTWHLTEALDLGVGLRGSWLDKEASQVLSYGTATRDYGGVVALPDALQPLAAALVQAPIGSQAASRSDSAWMPSAKIQYHATPHAMLYLSYARGFKAGGFNGADTTGNAENFPFDPEYVNAYEAGLKSEWLDSRLLLNVAAFLSDYSDLQVSHSTLSPGGIFISIVQNAASSRSQGIETEMQWAVSDELSLAVSGTYLHSRYRSYPQAVPSVLQRFNGQQVADLSGERTPYSPTWSGSVTGTYTTALPNDYRFTVELNSYFTSDYRRDMRDEWFGSYVRLDARLGIETADGRWAVDLIGKNLTDRTIYTFYGGQASSPGAVMAAIAQPRNFAVQVRYNW